MLQLYRYLNLHYLGDIDANHSVDGVMVPKYPEKETEEFKKAVHNANSSYAITLSMEFDVNGQPNIKAVLEGVAPQ